MVTGFTFVKTTALLCAGLFCEPALYGDATPEGTFTTQRAYSTAWGQSIIMFRRQDGKMFAIHRVRGKPSQRREVRLASTTPIDNKISMGCINVNDQTFKRLWEYPDGTPFTITP